MKRVLLITYAFSPLRNPRSIQAASYVKFLPQYNWEPWVVCVEESSAYSGVKDSGLAGLLPPGIRIVKVRSFEPRIAMTIAAYLAPFLLSLPDSSIGWYRPAYKRSLSLLEKEHFDLIFSCAFPPTSNLVGLKLKKETGLPWVAFFSDPWVESLPRRRNPVTRYVNQKLEGAVIAQADAIIFVSEGLRQLVMKKYPAEWLTKTIVVPHCYNPELVSRFEGCTKEPANSAFTITHTGTVYSTTNLAPLFQAIHRIQNKHSDIYQSMSIQFIGEVGKKNKRAISASRVNQVVSSMNAVPYLKSLEYMAKADVLLVICPLIQGSQIYHPTPSKLAEYLGFRKPILAITPLDASFVPLIKKLGAGWVVSPEDVDGIEQAIMTFYQDYREGNLSKYSYSDKDIEPYNAINTMEKLAQLFDETVRKSV